MKPVKLWQVWMIAMLCSIFCSWMVYCPLHQWILDSEVRQIKLLNDSLKTIADGLAIKR